MAHIEARATPDNAFVFGKLSNGTGVGDTVKHVSFVMLGGDVPHRIIRRGKESTKVHLPYKPKGVSY